MSKPRNGRALLVELLIVLFFFGLCTAIVLNSMVAVRTASSRASLKREALRCVQEDAAFIMGAESCEEGLSARGYEMDGDAWKTGRGELSFSAKLTSRETKAGTLCDALLSASYRDALLIEIPCSRYLPGEGDAQ